MKTFEELRKSIETRKAVSAWSKGVKVYALELLDELEESRRYNNADMHIHPLDNIKVEMLNGAKDWEEYSYGGSSLVYDEDIAQRLCSPSEIKKTRNGDRNPNGRESWLDVQARALYQACRIIVSLSK
jgi:hypothetical protein